mgnify:CR=1 FL=1
MANRSPPKLIRIGVSVKALTSEAARYSTPVMEPRPWETLVERLTDDGYVYTEDIRRYPDNPEEIITWRCTFDYPSRRFMAALDSDWSHRRDVFEPVADATRWTVQWSPQSNLALGLIRFLYFKIRRGKVIMREIMDPVRRHFEAG